MNPLAVPPAPVRRYLSTILAPPLLEKRNGSHMSRRRSGERLDYATCLRLIRYLANDAVGSTGSDFALPANIYARSPCRYPHWRARTRCVA